MSLRYICPYCSLEMPLADDQEGRQVKCCHCGMLGVAYGVNVRKGPAAADAAPQPPRTQPQPPSAERAPRPAPEGQPSEPQASAGPAAAPPELPTPAQVRRVGLTGGPRTPPLAVASLACGIAGVVASPAAFALCCCALPVVLSTLALVFGVIAYSRIKERPDEFKGSGLAVAGIVLGVAGLLIAAGVFAVFVAAMAASS